MSARERESGELPSPNLSLSDRKVGQGLIVSGSDCHQRSGKQKKPPFGDQIIGEYWDLVWNLFRTSKSRLVVQAWPRKLLVPYCLRGVNKVFQWSGN
jgi:hypothetical protein